MDGTWTETVRVDSGVPTVTLTATPTSGLGYVSRAYIEVEGRVVAEERREPGDLVGDVALMAPLTKEPPSGRLRQP